MLWNLNPWNRIREGYIYSVSNFLLGWNESEPINAPGPVRYAPCMLVLGPIRFKFMTNEKYNIKIFGYKAFILKFSHYEKLSIIKCVRICGSWLCVCVCARATRVSGCFNISATGWWWNLICCNLLLTTYRAQWIMEMSWANAEQIEKTESQVEIRTYEQCSSNLNRSLYFSNSFFDIHFVI